jgi:hypothetical protein
LFNNQLPVFKYFIPGNRTVRGDMKSGLQYVMIFK